MHDVAPLETAVLRGPCFALSRIPATSLLKLSQLEVKVGDVAVTVTDVLCLYWIDARGCTLTSSCKDDCLTPPQGPSSIARNLRYSVIGAGLGLNMDNVLLLLALPLGAVYLAVLLRSTSFKSFSLPSLSWPASRRRNRWPQPPKDYKPWPSPAPEASFKMSEAKELPLRPFRWGDYRLNMGIKPLDPVKWLELHTSYPSYVRLRQARHEAYGSRCVRTLPSPNDINRLAALEVARAVSAYLACRYPDLFSVTPVGAEKSADGWDVRSVRRAEMPEYDLASKSWALLDLDDPQGGDDAMRVAGELLPDDLAILAEEDLTPEERARYPGGVDKAPLRAHRLVAGSICTAGFWRLEDKIGLPLREIHTSGKVPHYEEKLMNPMDRFFAKMTPSKPVERIDNFFFQVIHPSQKDSITRMIDGSLVPDILDSTSSSSLRSSISGPFSSPDEAAKGQEVLDPTELSWSWSTNGPETLFDQVSKAPRKDGVMDPPKPTKEAACVVMRAERQTLRRMPRSKAILFTIRTYLTPVSQMANEAGVPGRLAAAIRAWPEDTARYKAAELYSPVVLPFLDQMHQRQLQEGIIEDEEREKERSRKNFPF